MDTEFVSDQAVIREFGLRIRRARLNSNVTRDALARDAGVSLSTVVRLESGESTALWGAIRVLRSLGLLNAVLDALPEDRATPLELARAARRRRMRASGARSRLHAEGDEVPAWPVPTDGR